MKNKKSKARLRGAFDKVLILMSFFIFICCIGMLGLFISLFHSVEIAQAFPKQIPIFVSGCDSFIISALVNIFRFSSSNIASIFTPVW